MRAACGAVDAAHDLGARPDLAEPIRLSDDEFAEAGESQDAVDLLDHADS